MALRLGIDIACRAAHQASLADESGNFLCTGRRFRTRADELEQLWAALPAPTEPAEVTVVMEPTRNAWVPLAAWFRRKGAHVVIVPPERSADLRAYLSRHTKSDYQACTRESCQSVSGTRAPASRWTPTPRASVEAG